MNPRSLGILVARFAGWAWFLIAGVGGLMLLIHEGPWPITNGWFAMFSRISACPLTGRLLKKRGAAVRGYVQFVAALLIMVAGRIAVVVVRSPLEQTAIPRLAVVDVDIVALCRSGSSL